MPLKADKILADRVAKLRLEAKQLRAKASAAVRGLRAETDKLLAAALRLEASRAGAFGKDFVQKISEILNAEAEAVATLRLSKPKGGCHAKEEKKSN